MSKILLIEDERDISLACKEYLEKQGYSVKVAFDGKEGLEKLKEEKPDLILLDVVMPVMDGMAVLEALKKNKDTENIPVIVLTNLDNQDFVAKAMRAGITNYLVKTDYTLEELNERVKMLLKQQS